MVPPWVKYPAILRASIGWRTGESEGSRMTVEGGIRSYRRCPNNGRFAPMAAIAPSGSLTRKAAVPAARFELRAKICRTMSISDKLVRRPDETAKGPAQTRRQTMRVMVFAKATEDSEKGVLPTTEAF